MEYSKIYDLLGFSSISKQVFTSQIELPISFIEQSPQTYGFLPALVPIWREDNDFIGYWRHWFCEKRPTTIVQQHPEYNYETEEIARNFHQLLVDTFLRKIAASEEGINESLLKICKVLGLDINAIKKHYDKYGDSFENYQNFVCFQNQEPLIHGGAAYNGSFPNGISTELHNVCSVELNDEIKAVLKNLNNVPIWLLSNDQEPIFYSLIENNDLSGAWLSLNSNGWEFSAAKKAIMHLANASQDQKFRQLAQVWATQEHERYGEY
ncbi:hypothetical protein VXS06_00015 [Photobacterium toruni]|uniref:Uncharacterized protein n=1 Tax=Photobacterium toruni TaxID=1935446 RepID=A0ABU6L1T1_9GAMM|nr:hypothetical protein [Photobacterium toruni]